MRKLAIIFFVLCMMVVQSVMIQAQTNDCTTATSDATATFTTMVDSTAQSFGISGDETITALTDFTWINMTDSFKIVYGCENHTILNGTTSTLLWRNIDASTINISNATSNKEIVSDNYTLSYNNGTVEWNLLNDPGAPPNGTLARICYNKTFTVADNLLNATAYTGSIWGITGTYNDYTSDIGFRTLTNQLDGSNWTATYSLTTRTCNARDSCTNTQGVIYAGLGLLIIVAIALAAFAIIQIFSGGDFSPALLSVTVVSILGLGIIVMIGFYIVSKVGESVCVV